MYNIASNNVISIECNTAESYSKKSIKPNNANISTRKKVNSRRNRKKQEGKEDRIVTAIVCGFHCAKSVQILSYFWSVFFRIRTE